MVIVVGGHTRNIGKTSVAAGIIRRMPEREWIALKITQFGHGVCTHGGHACECGPEPDHPYALSEEYEPGRADSERFLEAGARRSFWLRTAAGQLGQAMPAINKILALGANTVIESNSIMELIRPDLYLMVLDFAQPDFKPSALRFMDRADAFLIADSGINIPLWEDISRGLWDSKPHFAVRPPHYLTEAVVEFVRSAA